MGKDERGIVLSSEQKDRTLQNGRAEIHGLAVFHELLEQPQDLLVHWWASSCCKAAKILRSGCRRTLRFIILVGNVSSVIDNFRSTSDKAFFMQKVQKNVFQTFITLEYPDKQEIMEDVGEGFEFENAFSWITVDLECKSCFKKHYKFIEYETS